MINKKSIPSDKRGATIHLTACKLQLMDLAARISDGSVSNLDEISQVIWADIADIEELEG